MPDLRLDAALEDAATWQTRAHIVANNTRTACAMLRCEPDGLVGAIRLLRQRIGRLEAERGLQELRLSTIADRIDWVPGIETIAGDEWAICGSVLAHGQPALQMVWPVDFMLISTCDFWTEIMDGLRDGFTYPFSTSVELHELPPIVRRHRAMLRVLAEMRQCSESLRRLAG